MDQAVIFDLDGTLMDTLESIATAGNRALRDCGFSSLPVENYKYYAGDGADVLLLRALADAGDRDGRYFEQAKRSYCIWFKETCTEAEPYAGVRETLAALKKKRCKLAVLSNKPHERTLDVIHKAFGEDLFDAVQGQQDGLKRKPDPDGAFRICRRLGVRPEQCIYVGDTNVDMRTGTAAGMYTVGVLWGFRDRQELLDHGAMRLIRRPEELITMIENRD